MQPRRFLIPLALAVLLPGSGARAAVVTIFNSTTDPYSASSPAVVHPEGVSNNASAGSFMTPVYAGSISDLTLGLLCNGINSITQKPCASGSYASAGSVSAAVSNSTTVTVSNPGAFKAGYFIAAAAGNEIAQGKVYVTQVNGNTLTLSSPVTVTKNEALTTLAQGYFTVSLDANSAKTSPAGTTSPDVPGTTLDSFTVYDAELYVDNNSVAAKGPGNTNPAPVLYNFNNFDSVQLAPNTTYWIELSGSSSPATNSGAEWQFIDGNSGTGVANNYWLIHNYEGNCPSQDAGVCSFLNGGNLGVLHPVSVDMEISYAPEPAALAVLGSALAGLGLIRRRRRQA